MRVRLLTAATGTSDATDISARRYYRGGGGAAAAAAFAGIVGTGLAIAAAQNRRDYYDSYGYYGGGPAIMAAVRIITAMAITAAIGRACRIIADTPTPAGN